MKVLLVSESPVAGTILKFSEALNRVSGIDCAPFVLKGYKNNSFDIDFGVMSVFENWPQLLSDRAREADVIIMHNIADNNIVELVMAYKKPNSFIGYHYHSPPFEAPLYTYSVLKQHPFDAIFCVAQGHARFVENAIPVANIIEDINLVEGGYRRNSVFLGHLRTTDARWSSKVPRGFYETLLKELKRSAVSVYDIKKLYGSETVSNKIFINGLQSFSYVVDDVCSGLFHQTSLEALKSGCITFSAADEISLESFCSAAECPKPPFEQVGSPGEVIDRIEFYSRRANFLNKHIEENFSYSSKYLTKERLGNLFTKKLLHMLS